MTNWNGLHPGDHGGGGSDVNDKFLHDSDGNIPDWLLKTPSQERIHSSETSGLHSALKSMQDELQGVLLDLHHASPSASDARSPGLAREVMYSPGLAATSRSAYGGYYSCGSPYRRRLCGHRDDVECLRVQSAQQMDRLRRQLKQLKKEMRGTMTERQSSEQTVRDLRTRLETLQDEYDKLMDEVIRERKANFVSQSEKEQLELEVQKRNSEKMKIIKDRDKLRQALLLADERMKSLKIQLRKAETDANEVRNSWKNDLSNQKQQHKRDLEQLKNQMAHALQKWKDSEGERAKSMKAEYDGMRRECMEWQEAVSRLQKELADVKSKNVCIRRRARIGKVKNAVLLKELKSCRHELYGTDDLIPSSLRHMFHGIGDSGSGESSFGSIISGIPVALPSEHGGDNSNGRRNRDWESMYKELELRFMSVMDLVPQIQGVSSNMKERSKMLYELENRILKAQMVPTSSPSGKFSVAMESIPELIERHQRIVEDYNRDAIHLDDLISELKEAQSSVVNQKRISYDDDDDDDDDDVEVGDVQSAGQQFEHKLTIERLSMELKLAQQRESEILHTLNVARQVNEMMQTQLVAMQDVLNISDTSEITTVVEVKKVDGGTVALGGKVDGGSEIRKESNCVPQSTNNNQDNVAQKDNVKVESKEQDMEFPQVKDEDNEIQSIREQYDKLQQDYASLQLQFNELDTKHNILFNENGQLKTQHRDLCIELETLKLENDSLKKQLQETLTTASTATDTAIQQLRDELEKKNKEIQVREQRITEFKMRLEAKTQEFEQRVADMQRNQTLERGELSRRQQVAAEEVRLSLEESQERLDSIRSLQAQLRELESKNMQLEGQILKMVTKSEEELYEHQEETGRLKNELSVTQEKLASVEQELTLTKQKLAQVNKTLVREKKLVVDLENRRASLEASLKETQATVVQLEVELQNCKNESKQYLEEIERLQVQRAQMSKDLSETENIKAELENRLDATLLTIERDRAKIQEKEVLVTEQAENIRQLEEKLRESRQQCEELQQRALSCHATLEELREAYHLELQDRQHYETRMAVMEESLKLMQDKLDRVSDDEFDPSNAKQQQHEEDLVPQPQNVEHENDVPNRNVDEDEEGGADEEDIYWGKEANYQHVAPKELFKEESHSDRESASKKSE